MSEEEGALSEQNRIYIHEFMNAIRRLIDATQEPIDPKVIPLLEIALDCLNEQITMDKYYEFIQHTDTDELKEDILTADELKNMFEGGDLGG